MQMLTYADYQKNNFFRKPHWRWDRVLQMVDRYGQPGRCTKRDDDFIRKARKFLLAWRDAEDEAEKERLFWERPGLYYAYQMREKVNVDPEAAMFIEARLLARQKFDVIAKNMSTIPETVQWYEALFFNVVDHLDARDWITKHVLMPAFTKHPNNVIANHDGALPFKDSTVAFPFMDASLKLFGYFGGPQLVDFMLAGFQSGKPLTGMDDLNNWLDANWSTTIRRRSAQAALSFEINKYNVLELFAIHTQIIQIERSEESADQARTTTEKHIKAMIDEIPWMVGKKGAKALEGTELGKYDEYAAELRDEEVMRLAAGEVLDAEYLESRPKMLPPPRRKAGEAETGKDTVL